MICERCGGLAFLVDHDLKIAAPCPECIGGIASCCDAAGSTSVSFVCPRCGAESWNVNDVANRYCGRCHVFVDDEAIDTSDIPEADEEWFKKAKLIQRGE